MRSIGAVSPQAKPAPQFGAREWTWVYWQSCCSELLADPPILTRFAGNPAQVLQLSALRPGSSVVERGPEKAGVGGSIPSLATT